MHNKSNSIINTILSYLLLIVKWLIIIGIFIAIFFAWHQCLYKPLQYKTNAALSQVKLINKELSILKQKNTLSAQSLFSADEFMQPEQVNKYLIQAINTAHEVKIVSLNQSVQHNVAVKKLFTDVFDPSLTKLEQYQFAVQLQGGFIDVLQVLINLSQYNGLFWQKLHFAITNYPNAETELVFNFYSPSK